MGIKVSIDSGVCMPVFLRHPMRRLNQEEFRELDYIVMGIAFEIHNDLGRWLDEEIYEAELALRLSRAAIPAEPQFPLRLEHQSYCVTLHADLLVGGSTVYELKAASAISPAHRAQALNYLLLTEGEYAKLVNFGSPRVVGEFVSTSLSGDERRQVTVVADQWKCVSPASGGCREILTSLARDWGMFLECRIYRDALVHFFGGEPRVNRQTDLHLEGRFLGRQQVDLLDDDTLLAITALSDLDTARQHYEQLLRLTGRAHLQWANFRKRRLEFITLSDR